MTLLHPGDLFPTLDVPLAGGETLSLPDALTGGFGVVLFYRGAGARTATRSYAPFSEPRIAWPRWVPESWRSRSTTR